MKIYDYSYKKLLVGTTSFHFSYSKQRTGIITTKDMPSSGSPRDIPDLKTRTDNASRTYTYKGKDHMSSAVRHLLATSTSHLTNVFGVYLEVMSQHNIFRNCVDPCDTDPIATEQSLPLRSSVPSVPVDTRTKKKRQKTSLYGQGCEYICIKKIFYSISNSSQHDVVA